LLTLIDAALFRLSAVALPQRFTLQLDIGENAQDYSEIAKQEHLSGQRTGQRAGCVEDGHRGSICGLRNLLLTGIDRCDCPLCVFVCFAHPAIEVEVRKLNDKIRAIRGMQDYQRVRMTRSGQRGGMDEQRIGARIGAVGDEAADVLRL